MPDIKVALFGIGGYAANYLDAMMSPHRDGVSLVGAVDPYASGNAPCKIYASGEEMYRNVQPDIVVISTPIFCHVQQAVEAFEHNCHVVLEKPMAATMQDAQKIIEARDKAGKQLGIGFQMCYSAGMQALRHDAASGLFGAPMNCRCFVLWPRDDTYYHRGSGWAGKKYTADGQPVFDHILSNACAHYLMSMLYVAGTPLDSFSCATYHANPIETFDTAVLKGVTQNGVQLYMAASHAAGKDCYQDPVLEYQFEKAVVRLGGFGEQCELIKVFFHDGRIKTYGKAFPDACEKLWNMVDVIRGKARVGCTGEEALLHMNAMEKIRLSCVEGIPFPASWVRHSEGMYSVPDLGKELKKYYEQTMLPIWDLNRVIG